VIRLDAIKSISELYKRVKPALTTKKNELKNKNNSSITESQIWNNLKTSKWQKDNDLSLSEIIDDILFFKE